MTDAERNLLLLLARNTAASLQNKETASQINQSIAQIEAEAVATAAAEAEVRTQFEATLADLDRRAAAHGTRLLKLMRRLRAGRCNTDKPSDENPKYRRSRSRFLPWT